MNLLPLVSGLSIASKRHGVIPLTPNNAQRRIIREVGRAYDERRPARLIVLKARQIGISTISEAILFAWAIRFASTNCVVAAHDLESSMTLFQMTRMFYETFEYRHLFPTRFASQNRLMFSSNRSGIYVVTASRKSAGRGRTIHALHASEQALWGHPEETWLSFRQAVPDTPGSIIIIESTAQGMGNLFEQTWNEAKSGHSEYIPLFFAWFTHHEYIPCFGETCRDGTCSTCQQWGKGVRPRNSSEHELVKFGCKPAQLAWRRWAIENRCFGSEDLFRQEFPSTDEEAFLAAGINVFPETHIRNCFEPAPGHRGRLELDPRSAGRAQLASDPTGPLRVYKKPGKDQAYFIGADPAYGHGEDLAAAQVINRRTKEQVAVFHAKLNPIAFADELARLGAWYNMATIAPEVEGPGQACVARLVSIYPHVWTQVHADKMPGRERSFTQAGWSTSWRRKAWVLSYLANHLERGLIVLHDRPTYHELRCVPEEAEALTVDGWKSSRDVHVGDDLLTYNIETDRLEWQRAAAVSRYSFDGKLQSIRGFLATEHHRWPVRIGAKSRSRLVRQGRELRRTDQLIQAASSTAFPSESILTPRDAAILGWIVTDGTFRVRGTNSESVIYQSPKKFLNEVIALLGNEGSHRTLRMRTGPCGAVNVSAAVLRRLRAAGFCGKESLVSVVTRLSREACEAMWDAMMKAEGSSSPAHAPGAVFTQKRGSVLDAFQVLSFLLGHRVNAHRGSDRRANGYYVHLASEPRRFRTVNEVNHEPYVGTVWCPTTPNGTWVMRQRGQVVITGNSYVYYGSRGSELWGPGEARGHDDLVMALAIAVLCESTEPVLARDDAPATPRLGRIAGQNTIWAASEEDDESAGVDVWADL